MVDPNRKINRLPEKDVNFLEECESEFALRYTTDDAEFMAHCAKPVPEPPLVDNWMSGGGGGGGGGGEGGVGGGRSHSYNNRYNGGQRRGGGGNRGWQRRGGGPDRYRDNRHHSYEEYPRRDRGGRGGGGYGDRSGDRPYERRHRNEPQQSGPPMNVRRDYGNFVPASRD